ncbi:MAG TPA: cupin domain-containing protein [Candidatus Binatia bacterium]
MSGAARMHDAEHADALLLYVLQMLPTSEAAAVEERLASCAECRSEAQSLHGVVDRFVDWPTDVLRPSVALWGRLAERVGIGSDAARAGAARAPRASAPTADRAMGEPSAAAWTAPQWTEPEWTQAAPGIHVKLLASDAARQRVSMLVRLAPGVDYPPHRHAGVEELHLLEGELWIDDRKLLPGDFNRAEPGTADKRVWSETGCTCVLITSPRDELG